MRSHWSPFEIVTGALAGFLGIAFVCVFLEAGRIEVDLALRAASALDGAGLGWIAIEPRGRTLEVRAVAPDAATAAAALARASSVVGARRVDARIDVIGGSVACQALLNGAQADQAVAFRLGQAELTDASHEILVAVARRVLDCRVRVEVAVHGERRGSPAVSLALSQRRADLVARRLVDAGVAIDAVVATGYGTSQPVARPDEHGVRGGNQRVEFRVLGAAS